MSPPALFLLLMPLTMQAICIVEAAMGMKSSGLEPDHTTHSVNNVIKNRHVHRKDTRIRMHLQQRPILTQTGMRWRSVAPVMTLIIRDRRIIRIQIQVIIILLKGSLQHVRLVATQVP